MTKNFEQELKLVYDTITVQIPEIDPSNFRAINQELFIQGMQNLINLVYNDGYNDGFEDAKSEVTELIKKNFNFKLDV